MPGVCNDFSEATQARSTFIFDAATDTLCWDADGTGTGARVAVVVLQGVNSLSMANLELIWTLCGRSVECPLPCRIDTSPGANDSDLETLRRGGIWISI